MRHVQWQSCYNGWSIHDQDEVVFNDSIKAFEDATGIDIQYTGSKEFEASINIRLDGGDRPDMVDYPQLVC
jgi:alpha-glucoside transport system substrate-binding protein